MTPRVSREVNCGLAAHTVGTDPVILMDRRRAEKPKTGGAWRFLPVANASTYKLTCKPRT